MRAVVVGEVGGPEVLRLAEVADPDPGPGEARVRVEAIGVNFVDTYYRTGAYDAPLPFVPGMEAAGTIDAVGPDVDRVAVGDRVAWAMVLGTYAELVTVPSDRLVVVPEAVSTRDAATHLLQGLTALALADDLAQLGPGDAVLVLAAGGGLGSLLLQALGRHGVQRIGVVSRSAKAEAAVAAGADAVVVDGSGTFGAEVDRLTGGRGVAIAYDSVGASTWSESMRCVRPRGHLCICGQASGPTPPIDPDRLRDQGSITLSRPTVRDYIRDPDELRRRARHVFDLVADGTLRAQVDSALPLAGAADAHRRIESRRSTGKVLLEPMP